MASIRATEDNPNHLMIFTSESVSEGHPDKLADQISDAILDACLEQDPDSRVACETCCTGNLILLSGEITTKAIVDYEKVARDVCRDVGYDHKDVGLDYRTVEILNKIVGQSAEIYESVLGRVENSIEHVGAGDQGIMFGYATSETDELMPLTHTLATSLGKRLEQCRKNGILSWLRPDGKTQISLEYEKGPSAEMIPRRVHTVLVSAQHSPDVGIDEVREGIRQEVVLKVIPWNLIDAKTIFHINPSKSFTRGGPSCDAGLTGRKIIVDTYGGWGAHGGGAFSGKDCTKVDRSAAYASRWVAKSLVAAGFAKRVLFQVSYAIGLAHPLSIFVDSYGSVADGLTDSDLRDIVYRNFDLRPGCIITDLKLKEPMFRKFAVHGHMGRIDLCPAWENVKHLSHEWLHLRKKNGLSNNCTPMNQ